MQICKNGKLTLFIDSPHRCFIKYVANACQASLKTCSSQIVVLHEVQRHDDACGNGAIAPRIYDFATTQVRNRLF
jgi:hypothetical protein